MNGTPTFPVEFFEDRYGGVYSKGQWIAYLPATGSPGEVSRTDWLRDNGPNGGDLEFVLFRLKHIRSF